MNAIIVAAEQARETYKRLKVAETAYQDCNAALRLAGEASTAAFHAHNEARALLMALVEGERYDLDTNAMIRVEE